MRDVAHVYGVFINNMFSRIENPTFFFEALILKYFAIACFYIINSLFLAMFDYNILLFWKINM